MWFTCSYVCLLNTIFRSGILVSGMSTVWEDTNGFDNQYMYALAIYLMTVLSYSYGIIMNRAKMHLFMSRMLLMDTIQVTNVIRRSKWNFLVNYQVTTNQRFECFPVLQKMYSFNLHVNVYIL